MGHKCTVPTGMEINKEGNPYYTKCGLDALYRCGGWYLCAGHKKHLADMEKWPTELLKED